MIGITEKVLLSLEQYYDMVQEGFEQRKILSKKISDFELQKRSHLVVQLTLVCKRKDGYDDISKLNFVELAGSEQSVSQSDSCTRDATVRQFVSRSFNSLSE